MSIPKITVAIEPSDGISIFYEPVASKEAGGKPSGLVCLKLVITNRETSYIHLNQVTVSFAGPSTTARTIPKMPQDNQLRSSSTTSTAPGQSARIPSPAIGPDLKTAPTACAAAR